MSGYFGLTTGNDTGTESANYLAGSRFQNTVGTGTLTTVEMLFDDASVSGNVRLGVYADSTGTPGTRLLDAGAAAVADGFVAKTGLSLAVANSTYYWIVMVLSADNDARRQTGNENYYRSFSYAALPDPFGAGDLDTNYGYVMRAYVTIAVAGVTPPRNFYQNILAH